MFEAVFDHKERQNSEKEKRKHENGDGDSNIGVDSKRAEKFIWALEKTEDFIAFEFRAIVAKDGEIAGVQAVLEKGHVKKPVPINARVFHENEEAGEHCEERDAARSDDKRQLNVGQRAREQAEPLRRQRHEQRDEEEERKPHQLHRLAGHEKRNRHEDDVVENRKGNVDQVQGQVVSFSAIPAVEMLALDHRQLQRNCKLENN